MQRMLIVRSLRQDRVAFCVTSFIVTNLGSRFIEPPVLNMKLVGGSASLSPRPLGLSCLPSSVSVSCISLPLRSRGLLPDAIPVLLAGDGGFNPTIPTCVHPVPWCGPHQCPAPAGRAHRHGPAFPRPVPGPGPGPYRCPTPPRGCYSGLVSILSFTPIFSPVLVLRTANLKHTTVPVPPTSTEGPRSGRSACLAPLAPPPQYQVESMRTGRA